MIRINLLAPERTKKAAAAPAAAGTLRLALLVAVFVGGASVLCAAGWMLQKSKLEDLAQQIEKDRRREQDLQAVKRQVDEFQNKKLTLEKKVQLIEKLRLAQKSPVHMLDELSKALPDFVWLVSFGETAGGIAIKGESNSLAAVADFMNALQGTGWFTAVELAGAQENGSLVSFDLTGRFSDPDLAALEAKQKAENEAANARRR